MEKRFVVIFFLLFLNVIEIHSMDNKKRPREENLFEEDIEPQKKYQKTEQPDPLIKAVQENNELETTLLVLNKHDLNKRNTYAQTPLMLATIANHKTIVKLLVEAKADLTLTDTYGNTALMWAVAQENPDLTQLLIQAKSDVNRGDNDLVTPLMSAAQNGNSSIIKLLISSGASVCAQDKSSDSALTRAIKSNQEESVALLLPLCSVNFINKCDTNGCTPLMLAEKRKNNDIIQLLKIAQQDWDKRTEQLQQAASMGLTQLLYYLVSFGVSKEDITQALIYAIKAHKLDNIDMLIALGANYNQALKDTEALEAAVCSRSIINFLELPQFDIKSLGIEIVRLAVLYKYKDIIEACILKGVDISADSSLLRTTIWSEDKEFINYLLALGFSLKEKKGESFIRYARKKSANGKIISLLIKAGAHKTN